MQFKLLLILFFLTYYKVVASNNFICKKGVIDLSSYDYESDIPIKLNGQWLFRWNTFHEFKPGEKKIQYAAVPGPWNVLQENSLLKSQTGHCTYALKIILPEKNKLWSLYLPPIHSAYKLYIDNKLISKVGNPAPDKNMEPGVLTQIVHFVAPRQEVNIRFEVSNYHFVSGGILAPIKIGNPKTIEADREKSFFISSFLMGSLFIMGLYHFALFILWSKDKGTLYFGILCLLMGLRESFGREAMFYHAFPSIDYELSLKLLYSIFPLCFIAFNQFFNSLFSTFSNLLKKITLFISLFFLMLVFGSSNPVYGKYLPVISLAFFVEFLYLILIVFKKVHENSKENTLVLLGLTILLGCCINDVLFEQGFITSYFLLPTGFFLFILFHSILISIRFTNAFRQSDILSLELVKSNQAFLEIQSNFQQEILKTQLEIQEQTFQDISGELHDNVGQVLSLIRLNLFQIEKHALETAKAKIFESKCLLDKTIEDIRDFSKSLSTDFITQLGFIKAVEKLLLDLNKTDEYFTSLSVTGTIRKLDSEREIILYRIFQELINNIIKHAEATTIEVSIKYKIGNLVILIKDNGRGFNLEIPQDTGSKGLGLQNIKRRTKLLNCSITFECEENKGTTVTLSLPY